MADEPATPSDAATPVDADAQPQEGTDDAPTPEDGSATLSAEDARKLRSESQQLRKRLKDAEAKLVERENADLTDQQRATRDLETAKADREQLATENRTLRGQIVAAQSGVAADRVEDAVKLLDWDNIDDPSDARQVKQAFKQLVKDKPWLGSQNSASTGMQGGNGRGGAPEGDLNQTIRGLIAGARGVSS